jgi:hypothetical protein
MIEKTLIQDNEIKAVTKGRKDEKSTDMRSSEL